MGSPSVAYPAGHYGFERRYVLRGAANPGPAFCRTAAANPIKLLPNGNFLINFSNALVDGGGSVIQEVDLTGKLIWADECLETSTRRWPQQHVRAATSQ